MRKFTRAASAFAVAAVMSMSLSSVAFADNELVQDAENGVTSTTFTSTITTNEGNTPKTAFTYTVAPADARTVGADRVTTYAGVAGGVTFSNDQASIKVPFAANDAEEEVGLKFNAGVFTQPGIYHYTITQSGLSAEQANIGLRADKDPQKSLDVYVAKKDGNLVVTSVILAQKDETVVINGSESVEATKVGGFTNAFGQDDPNNPPVDPDDPDNPNPPDPDDPDVPYSTVNKTVTLAKTVTGAMGDTNMQFPFDVTISYEEGEDADTTLEGMKVTVYKTDAAGNKDAGTTMTFGATALTQPFTLAHGEKLSVVFPKAATVKVQEKTNAAEGYSITGTLDGVQDTTLNGTVNADANGMSKLMETEDVAFAYTNDRETISPTGVMLTFAPYLLIAAAGVLVLVVSRRRKADELD